MIYLKKNLYSIPNPNHNPSELPFLPAVSTVSLQSPWSQTWDSRGIPFAPWWSVWRWDPVRLYTQTQSLYTSQLQCRGDSNTVLIVGNREKIYHWIERKRVKLIGNCVGLSWVWLTEVFKSNKSFKRLYVELWGKVFKNRKFFVADC